VAGTTDGRKDWSRNSGLLLLRFGFIVKVRVRISVNVSVSVSVRFYHTLVPPYLRYGGVRAEKTESYGGMLWQ